MPRKKKVVVKTPEPEKVVEETPEVAEVAEGTEGAEVEEEVPLTNLEKSKELASDLEEVSRVLRTMAKNLRAITRAYEKEIKTLQKKTKKPKDPNRPKRQTGFQKTNKNFR